MRNSIDFLLNIFQPNEHSWIQVRETKKNNKKPWFTRRLTAFFSQLENSCLPKKKHSRNQLELTNYFFLLWKRNKPYNMPKSDYITGNSQVWCRPFWWFWTIFMEHMGFQLQVPRTPEGNSSSLPNTQSVSTFFRIVSIQVRRYFVHRHTFY